MSLEQFDLHSIHRKLYHLLLKFTKGREERKHTSLERRSCSHHHRGGDAHNGKPGAAAEEEEVHDWNILDIHHRAAAAGKDTLSVEEADKEGTPRAAVEAAQTGTPAAEGTPTRTLKNRTTQFQSIGEKDATFDQKSSREQQI